MLMVLSLNVVVFGILDFLGKWKMQNCKENRMKNEVTRNIIKLNELDKEKQF
jgi:hypothetical protein